MPLTLYLIKQKDYKTLSKNEEFMSFTVQLNFEI